MSQTRPIRAKSHASEPRPAAAGRALEILVVIVLATVVRLIHLGHTPMTDELYHVLAARSLLTDGTLDLPGGSPYSRAVLFTYATAFMFRLFGVGMEVARILPLVAGVALTTALFLWVRAHAGRASAWAAALVIAFAPISIYLSQFARFYTVHALLFFLAAIAIYQLATAPPRSLRGRAGLVLVAAAALLLASHLQSTTLVGLLALAAWLVGRYGRVAALWVAGHQRRLAIIGAAALFTTLVTWWAISSGLLERLWWQYRWADLWALDRRNAFRHYHYWMVDQYALLWGLFPFAIVLGVLRQARLTAFALTIFATVFVIHSFGGFKDERYLFYALPFFATVLGVAFGTLLPVLWHWTLLAVGAHPAVPRKGRTAFAGFLVASGLLFAVNSNQAATYFRHMLSYSDAEWTLSYRYRGEPDWEGAAREFAPQLRTAEVVVASTEAAPLYYLDRLDYLLRPVIAWDTVLVPEFGPDPKSRRPVVTTPESLQVLLECHATGLILIEEKEWDLPSGVPPATAEFIRQHTERLRVSADLRIRAYQWRTAQPATRACPLQSKSTRAKVN